MGKDSGRTYEIQRLVGRSLRTITDMKSLGERSIWIDCDVIQADGGTRTASITGSFVALADALNKVKKNGLLNKIPVKDFVAATSVGIVNGSLMLDLAYEEDSQAEVDMNIVMTSSLNLVEVQGTAEGSTFSREELTSMINLGEKVIPQIVKKQNEALSTWLMRQRKTNAV